MIDVDEKHPNLDAVVKMFDLAKQPIDLYLRGANGDIDFGRLVFGKRYRAVRAFKANVQGEVRKGEKLHFLGQYYLPQENGLCLYFERADASKLVLKFEGNQAEAPDSVRMMSDLNLKNYFEPVMLDLSKRSKRLMAARAVISFHRKGGRG